MPSTITSRYLSYVLARNWCLWISRWRSCSTCRRLGFLFVRDASGMLQRRRVRTRRILESEDGVKLAFVQQRERFLEFLLGLSREADDDVAW